MNAVSIAITVVVGASLLWEVARRDALRTAWEIARRINLRAIVTTVPVMVVTIGVSVLLYQVPWLQWGWLQAVTGTAGNVTMIGVAAAGWWVAPLFLLLLVVAMPSLAFAEETLFRAGTRTWRNAAVRSVAFGLIHLVAGIPIAVALSLTIAGLWYTHQYFKGGVARSTVYHLTWNYLILVAVAVTAVVHLVGAA